MENIINEFRAGNGKPLVTHWDRQVCNYCQLHNFEMSKRRYSYHTPDYYLVNWKEAIAVCSYYGENYEDIQRKLIFEVLAQSEGHRDILLNCSILAYAFYINDYVAYLTIRGK